MSQLSISPDGEQSSQYDSGVDTVKLGQFMHQLRAEQSLVLGILGGLFAAIVAGGLWALIAFATGYMFGIAAIGVGFLVGLAVRFLGKGIDPSFGIVGAVLALFGCLLGNFLTVVIFASQLEGVPFLSIMLGFISSPGLIPEVLAETFNPMDLLFYGLAIYQGYKISLRPITEEEIASFQKPQTSQQTEISPPANV